MTEYSVNERKAPKYERSVDFTIEIAYNGYDVEESTQLI